MTTILTIDKLAEITPISTALSNQVNLISPFIEFAEQANLRDGILGISLYDEIINQIETTGLSTTNQTLCDSYLYNLSAWYSLFEASPFVAYRAEAKGVTKKFSDNSQALDKEEIAIWRQAILDKATYWRNACLTYLSKHEASYPLWRCSDDNPIDKTEDFGGGIYV